MRILLLNIILGLTLFANAQQINIGVKVDTNVAMIGKSIMLELQSDWPEGIEVEWPVFEGDTLGNGIEVMERMKLDTIADPNGRILKQTVAISSFDTGYTMLPEIAFVYKHSGGTDTFLSNAIPMAFVGMTVDMQKGMVDIKPPLEIPFFIDWMIVGLVVLALIVVGAAVWFFFMRKKDEVEKVERKPSIPPFITAKDSLDKLKSSKTYEDIELTKEFYTELTDIIRTYIEFQFGIRALESTTDEILEGTKRLSTTEDTKAKFNDLLVTADLAKFAKTHPTPSENEAFIDVAYQFIEQTKPVAKPAAEENV